MSGFTPSNLEKKLLDLNNSAQSIQQTSLWLLHHRKHRSTIVKVWIRQFLEVDGASKKLTLLYLANDVVQNARKKYLDFITEFGSSIKVAIEHMESIDNIDLKVVGSISRLLKIWAERGIFNGVNCPNSGRNLQADLDRIWSTKELEMRTSPDAKPAKSFTPTKRTLPDSKKLSDVDDFDSLAKGAKRRLENNGNINTTMNNKSVSKLSATTITASVTDDSSTNVEDDALFSEILHNPSPPDQITVSSVSNCTIDETITLNDDDEENESISNAPIIDSEQLMKALENLENAASSDVKTRYEIAELPPDLSEPSHLQKLTSLKEGERLLEQVDSAKNMLKTYNGRLSEELEERRRVSEMIKTFIMQQRKLESEAEDKLQEYKERLERINKVREQLKTHISFLPDLSKLDEGSPLPSAGDLFTAR